MSGLMTFGNPKLEDTPIAATSPGSQAANTKHGARSPQATNTKRNPQAANAKRGAPGYRTGTIPVFPPDAVPLVANGPITWRTAIRDDDIGTLKKIFHPGANPPPGHALRLAAEHGGPHPGMAG